MQFPLSFYVSKPCQSKSPSNKEVCNSNITVLCGKTVPHYLQVTETPLLNSPSLSANKK